MSGITERLTAALADRYRIERELGQGGMATVFLAEDLKHKRHVAVKVLKPELAAVLGAERFVQEITTTAALQHPHILPLFDSGTADGFLFYVMPFIDGETLRGKLDRETQLGVDEALRITTDVADALHYAHEHGVIHRDIKPENILLANGRPMVADFGIALAVSAAAGGRMTETGLSLGTPHYMSPEQATAEKEITARSDIYSLGSVLYEMLAGQPPHLGGSAQQIIMKIISQEAADVTEHRKSVPPHVADAIAISLQKLPADRFESAKVFAEALEGSRASSSARGAGSRTLARAAAPAAPRRVTVRAAGLVLVGVLLGAFVAVTLTPRPPAELTRRVAIALRTGEEPVVTASGGSLVAAARNANIFAYASRGPAGQPQLRVRRWDRMESETIELPTTVCCIRFSPSGDSIAYLAAPNRLWVQRLAGGAPVMIADSAIGSVTDGTSGMDWADDGNLYVTGTTGVLRVAPDGSRITEITPFAAAPGVMAAAVQQVLPGNKAAVVTVYPSSLVFDPTTITVGILHFASGRVESITRGFGALYASSGHLLVGRTTGTLAAVPFDAKALRVTGPEVALPDTILTGAAITADGSLLFERGAAAVFSLTWVSRDGSVTPVRHAVPGVLFDPRVSPDGRQILIGSVLGTEAPHWVMSTDGSNARVVAGDGVQGYRAIWNPRRAAVSFVTGAVSVRSVRPQILEQPLGELREAREIPRPDPRVVGSHVWSPDGVWLVFRTDNGEAGNGDILAYRPGVDSVATPVATSSAEELDPAISPDGRWLAYSSDATGTREIYVTRFPPERSGQVRVSTGGGVNPLWSRDGRELFFFDAASNLVAVSVETSPTFRAGVARRLFTVQPSEINPFSKTYDISPDGQRFLMMRSTASASSRLMLITNLLDELRRIAPH